MKNFLNRTGLFLILICCLCVAVNAQSLVPGGQVIGLELGDNTVTVAAFDEALGADAKQAGLKVGDQILSVNGKPVHTAADVRYALERSEGVVEVKVQRNKKSNTLRFTPAVTADGPKLGVFLKQGVTGIGTVTWYDPDTGKFGTLGHGVNNPRGELLNMVSGSAYQASVVSVRKGACGNPGQLMGTLQDAEPIGSLYKNTSRGIFGITDKGWSGDLMPLGSAKDVRTGAATIRSTVQGNSVQEYSVEILKVYPNTGATGRNILLKITGPQL